MDGGRQCGQTDQMIEHFCQHIMQRYITGQNTSFEMQVPKGGKGEFHRVRNLLFKRLPKHVAKTVTFQMVLPEIKKRNEAIERELAEWRALQVGNLN